MKPSSIGPQLAGPGKLIKQILVFAVALAMVVATVPFETFAAQDNQDSQANPYPDQPTAQPDDQSADQTSGAPRYAQQTPEQLQQLVAPIALYPDSLVAQILAAATFPEQVVEADRWVQTHPDLKGDALGQAVDQESWDPSVKALTGFPSVLGNMDKNISWTSSLGDAYYNQQQDVMDAVQFMRKKAQAAGNLKSTPQQTVNDDPYGDVDIAPADPSTVYVPAYNPWAVYGYPVAVWPGWYEYPGIWYGGPYLSWGLGFGIGWYGGFGWGWGGWGFDWHNRYAIYNHERFYSHSRTFYNRNAFYRGGVRGGGVFNRPNVGARPYEGNRGEARGYAPSHQSGMNSGAFSHYDHGGESRGYSSRGESSFHGGGFSGGRGGFGGGGHGGGGRR
jgi:uncharacterized membrane protein YgcG